MSMNKLNNTRKVKRNIVRTFAALCLGLLSIGFTACDDGLDVTQAYPFTVETMPVPKELAQGETAEIRCELVREGEFDGAVYTIRYFQYDGEGTLKLDNGLVLQPLEFNNDSDAEGDVMSSDTTSVWKGGVVSLR